MTSLRFSPPAGPIHAELSVPGSKSVANRALICALLANGESIVRGLPDGDDTQVIIEVLRSMSVLDETSNGVVIRGNPRPQLPGIIDAALAGTSSRFLTAVAAIAESVCIIDGEAPLRARPMGDLHDALTNLGVALEPLGVVGHLPVSVTGGVLDGGEITISADVSSQFISALMLIGPLMRRGLTIRLVGDKVSESYIHMTARVMSSFGVVVHMEDNTITVPAGAYKGCEYVVEPDFSSAAFPIVAVLLRGGRLRLSNLARAMSQGDSAILEIVSKLGATVTVVDNDVEVIAPSGVFVDEISLSMADCSDLVPVVAVLLSQCVGLGRISDVGFIRHKESDRLGDVATELTKVGVNIVVTDDGLSIVGGGERVPAVLETHHDHRLAMSFALLALCIDGIEVRDSEVVSKSWPNYFSDMADILGPNPIEN